MAAAEPVFFILGALSAFPQRLAGRALAAKGARLQRGLTRRTSHVVLGRGLLEKKSEADIEQRIDALRAGRAELMSESGLLRWLSLLPRPANAETGRDTLLQQSRLPPEAFEHLSLFDAFESDREPFTFRDVILARKYAGLIAGGATWSAVARAVHRSTPTTSLTALALYPEGPERIYAMEGEIRSELDGQRLLALDTAEDDVDEIFAMAEDAEAVELFAEAAALYERCLVIDPDDPVAAFNLANCLMALKQPEAAALAYAQALRSDPNFVEAWFNFGGLLQAQGKIEAARQHLSAAIAIDPSYESAIYNLAQLEFEADNLLEARRWWARYLELDSSSEWARTAARGLAYIDLKLNRSTG